MTWGAHWTAAAAQVEARAAEPAHPPPAGHPCVCLGVTGCVVGCVCVKDCGEGTCWLDVGGATEMAMRAPAADRVAGLAAAAAGVARLVGEAVSLDAPPTSLAAGPVAGGASGSAAATAGQGGCLGAAPCDAAATSSSAATG